jgi:hypothetical protein
MTWTVTSEKWQVILPLGNRSLVIQLAATHFIKH